MIEFLCEIDCVLVNVVEGDCFLVVESWRVELKIDYEVDCCFGDDGDVFCLFWWGEGVVDFL